MINKQEQLRVTINALVQSMPNVRNVIIISVIFFFSFGIIAVNLLKGRYYECRVTSLGGPNNDAWFSERGITIKNKYDCFNYGGSWV